jgi:hypothetical protein
VNIGLKKSDADLAKRFFHVFGGELSFATQVLKNPL